MTFLLALALAVAEAPAPPAPAPAATPAQAAPMAAASKEEAVLEEIVAWVNDDTVLASDLHDTEQEMLGRAMEHKQPTADEMSAKAAEVKRTALVTLISNRLLVQEAERLYDVNAVKKDLLKDFKDRQKIRSDDELDRVLKQYGISRDELADRLLMGFAPDKVVQLQVTGSMGIPEAETRAYYDEHRATYTTPAEVTFREILLRVASPDQLAARRPEAEAILARARGGADFATLVTAYSESPSKSIGGKIGPVQPRDLIPEVANAALGTKVGAVAEPFATAQGWVILRVEERTEERVTPYEDVRDECERALRQQKFGPAYDKFVAGLWKKATIEVRKGYADRIGAPWKEMVTALR